MKRWRGLALGTLTVFLLSAPSVDAAQEPAAAQKSADAPQMTSFAENTAAPSASAKADKKAQRDAAHAQKKEAKAAAKREKSARYKTLFTDSNFTYYMDAENTRWIPRPYLPGEKILDVWVRLVENQAGAPVVEDGRIRPTKYFLEHYYISPKRRQIMFISELEVTGRPENAIKERPYDPRNWEQLVPGSLEDEIFDTVTARVKYPNRRGGILSGTSGMSLRDMLEEFGRISL